MLLPSGDQAGELFKPLKARWPFKWKGKLDWVHHMEDKDSISEEDHYFGSREAQMNASRYSGSDQQSPWEPRYQDMLKNDETLQKSPHYDDNDTFVNDDESSSHDMSVPPRFSSTSWKELGLRD